VNYLDRKEWKYTLRNIGIRTLIVGLIAAICAGVFFLSVDEHENFWIVFFVKYFLFATVTGFSLFYFSYKL
jgi:hypothetical protein